MLFGVLHFIPDEDDPYGIVARLLAALPSGKLPGRPAPDRGLLPGRGRRAGQLPQRGHPVPVPDPGRVRAVPGRPGAGPAGAGADGRMAGPGRVPAAPQRGRGRRVRRPGPQALTEAEGDRMASDQIDTTVPHSARIWNYWLGGKDNYPVDREAGDRFVEVSPDIVARGPRGPVLPGPRGPLPGRRGRHPAVPRRRHRAAHGRQHPRGRAAGRTGVPDRLRRQRPAGPGARPRAADVPARRRLRLRRRRRTRTGGDHRGGPDRWTSAGRSR